MQSFRQDRSHLSGPHDRSNLPEVRLEIRRGKAKNLLRDVTGPVYLIGSARDCDLVLGDAQFPDAYAYVFVNESGVTVRRLGLGPELTVNGEVVEGTQLADGDRVRTGPFEFSVQVRWPGPDEDAPRRRPFERRRPRLTRGQRQAAEQRVAGLLSEIQHAMFPPQLGLRIFVGPDESLGEPKPADRKAHRRETG